MIYVFVLVLGHLLLAVVTLMIRIGICTFGNSFSAFIAEVVLVFICVLTAAGGESNNR